MSTNPQASLKDQPIVLAFQYHSKDGSISSLDYGKTREHSTDSKRPSPGNPLSPLDLGDEFAEGYTWSNKAKDMALHAYFDPGQPNIAEEFSIPGLRPVLKDLDGETYLLTADNGKFYMWAPDHGRLWAFKSELKLNLRQVVEEVLAGVREQDLIEYDKQ